MVFFNFLHSVGGVFGIGVNRGAVLVDGERAVLLGFGVELRTDGGFIEFGGGFVGFGETAVVHNIAASVLHRARIAVFDDAQILLGYDHGLSVDVRQLFEVNVIIRVFALVGAVAELQFRDVTPVD